jgi:hypothetical protein
MQPACSPGRFWSHGGEAGMAENWHEAAGAIHLHSDFSDGSLPIPEIAAIASGKDLDFLMFSDHHTLEPKRRGLEGWHGRVLVLAGYEINDADDHNHYLAFRLDREVEAGLPAGEYVRRVKAAGGIGIIAHPAEKRSFSEAYPPYPWTEWDSDDFDGIEIWNQMSEWLEGVRLTNIAWRILHPLRSIRYPVWETLARWDALNRRRRVIGVGGIDVHAKRVKILGLFPVEIYPYKVQFKSIRTHILTRKPLVLDGVPRLSFREAEVEVYDALTSGRCFIVNYSLGSGAGFRFRAEDSASEYAMGSRIKISTRLALRCEVPMPADLRLMRNGRICSQCKSGRSLDHEVRMPGVYRMEVFRRKKGWIYSNPIVVLERGGAG